MVSPKAPLLRDVLEEHLEELAFLWGLRRDGLSSPDLTRAGLSRIEARVEAHADGLALAGGELLDLASPGLGADDPAVAFASGYALLRAGREGADAVLDAFREARGGTLEGLAEALAHGEGKETREALSGLAASADGALAVAASTALAIQRAPGLPERVEERFVDDPAPAVRSAAWRLATLLREAPRPEAVRRGLADPDPAVALEAAAAAAWFALPAALDACRERAVSGAAGAGEWLRLLATLGAAADVGAVLAAAEDRRGAGAGAAGPRALGALGHPRGVDALVRMMEDEDAARAAAAGRAFGKVTGLDAAGERRPGPEAPSLDGGADEEADDVALPDAAAAGGAWAGVRASFARAERWCRGLDVSATASGELPGDLDTESYREIRLRGRFYGSWKGDAATLLRMAPSGD